MFTEGRIILYGAVCMLINVYFNITKCKYFPQQYVFIDTQSSYSLEKGEQVSYSRGTTSVLIKPSRSLGTCTLLILLLSLPHYLHWLPGTTLVASRSTVDTVLSGVPKTVIVSWTLKKGTLKSHLKYNLLLSFDYCHNIQAHCFHSIRPSIVFPLHKYRRSDTIQNIMSKRTALSNIVVGEFPAGSYSKSITMQAFIITENFTLTLPSLSVIGIVSINKMKYACCVTKWVVY
jgi:hypothetical protein